MLFDKSGKLNPSVIILNNYTIEKKVVIPAINSVLTVVSRSLSLKNVLSLSPFYSLIQIFPLINYNNQRAERSTTVSTVIFSFGTENSLLPSFPS